MKPAHLQNQGFTMIEMMLAVAIGSLMLAATMAASICLQRSFNAVDNSFLRTCNRCGSSTISAGM